MATRHSDEFKRDAVRIALTSGLTMRQVASDLGIGLSTLGSCVRSISKEAKAPAQDAGLLRETERLRKESPDPQGGEGGAKKSGDVADAAPGLVEGRRAKPRPCRMAAARCMEAPRPVRRLAIRTRASTGGTRLR
jgi:transposase